MKEIIWKPELYSFDTCQEFVNEFQLCKTDLVLTNEYIYQPYFGSMNLDCMVRYQEAYGMGEPTDIMTEAIMHDVAKTDCREIIAIGGGTVIDIAKVLAVAGDESIDALYDMAPNLPKRRELIILPTTCGTGSEVTNISILNRTRLGTKMGLVGPGHVCGHSRADPAAFGKASLWRICNQLHRRSGPRSRIQPFS